MQALQPLEYLHACGPQGFFVYCTDNPCHAAGANGLQAHIFGHSPTGTQLLRHSCTNGFTYCKKDVNNINASYLAAVMHCVSPLILHLTQPKSNKVRAGGRSGNMWLWLATAMYCT